MGPVLSSITTQKPQVESTTDFSSSLSKSQQKLRQQWILIQATQQANFKKLCNSLSLPPTARPNDYSDLLKSSGYAVRVQVQVFIDDQNSIAIPIDLAQHSDLDELTSGWLHKQVVKQLPQSSDESMCLSTLDNQAESVDYFLTQPTEPLANFLSFTRPLKVCYVSTRERQEEKIKKQSFQVVIQDFDFIKVLGKGGFATVYMVRKRTSGNLYAMKMVKKSSVDGDDLRFQQVLSERNILTGLQEPFIVQLHYAFTTRNYYCLVLDLCTGGELFHYIQKLQNFSVIQAKVLFAEVLQAIQVLHQKNILYRDLKPENILVDERGHLKLTDFGLCKINFSREDLTSSFVGSPEYMSPEILSGELYGYSVDYYTLGVLFFEMIVGLPPHYSENKIQMYQDIRKKPTKVPEIFGDQVRDLIESLLKIDPSQRLGCRGGIQEIKDHPFFKEIDWIALQNRQTQSFMRRLPIQFEINCSNFDVQYTELPIDIDLSVEKQNPLSVKKLARSKSDELRKGVISPPKKITKQQTQTFYEEEHFLTQPEKEQETPKMSRTLAKKSPEMMSQINIEENRASQKRESIDEMQELLYERDQRFNFRKNTLPRLCVRSPGKPKKQISPESSSGQDEVPQENSVAGENPNLAQLQASLLIRQIEQNRSPQFQLKIDFSKLKNNSLKHSEVQTRTLSQIGSNETSPNNTAFNRSKQSPFIGHRFLDLKLAGIMEDSNQNLTNINERSPFRIRSSYTAARQFNFEDQDLQRLDTNGDIEESCTTDKILDYNFNKEGQKNKKFAAMLPQISKAKKQLAWNDNKAARIERKQSSKVIARLIMQESSLLLNLTELQNGVVSERTRLPNPKTKMPQEYKPKQESKVKYQTVKRVLQRPYISETIEYSNTTAKDQVQLAQTARKISETNDEIPRVPLRHQSAKEMRLQVEFPHQNCKKNESDQDIIQDDESSDDLSKQNEYLVVTPPLPKVKQRNFKASQFEVPRPSQLRQLQIRSPLKQLTKRDSRTKKNTVVQTNQDIIEAIFESDKTEELKVDDCFGVEINSVSSQQKPNIQIFKSLSLFDRTSSKSNQTITSNQNLRYSIGSGISQQPMLTSETNKSPQVQVRFKKLEQVFNSPLDSRTTNINIANQFVRSDARVETENEEATNEYTTRYVEEISPLNTKKQMIQLEPPPRHPSEVKTTRVAAASTCNLYLVTGKHSVIGQKGPPNSSNGTLRNNSLVKSEKNEPQTTNKSFFANLESKQKRKPTVGFTTYSTNSQPSISALNSSYTAMKKPQSIITGSVKTKKLEPTMFGNLPASTLAMPQKNQGAHEKTSKQPRRL